MNVSETVGVCWLAFGVLTVAVIVRPFRSGDKRGLLSEYSRTELAIYTVALIVGAPALILFALAVSAKMLWQGRIPLTDATWWPARARQIEFRNSRNDEGEFSRSSILCEMVNVRKRRDARLRGSEPSNWPMIRLWLSPEGRILDAVADFQWLLDAGLTEEQALSHMLSLDGRDACSTAVTTLRAFIEHSLKFFDPSYIDLEAGILTKNIKLAGLWAAAEIKHLKLARSYPPPEWLRNRVHFADVAPQFTMATRSIYDELGKRNWDRIKVRMVNDDELWAFRSPPDDWRRLAGREGVALIRRGRPIAKIVTLMS